MLSLNWNLENVTRAKTVGRMGMSGERGTVSIEASRVDGSLTDLDRETRRQVQSDEVSQFVEVLEWGDHLEHTENRLDGKGEFFALRVTRG